MTRRQRRTKHTLDRLASLASLVGLSPVFAVIALSVWLEDQGPVFFTQTRAGVGMRPFRIVKFRTMIVDADRFLDAAGRPTRPRVTRTGRLLRRWSLDELPQLLNVVVGDMSIVGPRPCPMDYARQMTSNQQRRFLVRPGLTGLAQVTGRHSQTWSQRVKRDVEYVDNWSWRLEAHILVRTLSAVADPDTLLERGDPAKVDLG